MTQTAVLIAELESAAATSSFDKRSVQLQRITDLFLSSAGRLTDQQIGLFDDVLMQLIKRVEIKALEELSLRLAPAPNAPIGVIKHLARHDDILGSGPVLGQSERLT